MTHISTDFKLALLQEGFRNEGGIFIPANRPRHRENEYNERGFEVLLRMQREHFWYQGRHNFLLRTLYQALPNQSTHHQKLAALDLGGGCGGWLEYLRCKTPDTFDVLALGDSSSRALTLAGPIVGSFAARFQIDLMNLPWEAAWDVIFLLDVLEHIPDHSEALRQIRRCLCPGGLLFVTTPALQCFWTYNDVLAHHQRRYSRQDFLRLGAETCLDLVRADYFMCFLSPLLMLTRLLNPPKPDAPLEVQIAHQEKTHAIPFRPINYTLGAILAFETALQNWIPLPFGTSILAVYRR